MKRIAKLLLFMTVCLTVALTCTAMSSAASLQKVNNLVAYSETAVSISLKWNKVAGATGYRIYRYNSSKEKYVYIGKTINTKYTDKSLSAGKYYKYKVIAYQTRNGKNTYGAYSAALKAVTNPRKVTKLKVSNLNGDSAVLSWAKASGATGYRIYVYDNAKKKYISDGVSKTTSYTLDNLKKTTTYYVKVAAYHTKMGTHYGTKSEKLTFTTPLPAVKSFGTENVTTSSYSLVWAEVDGAVKYQIYRFNTEDNAWERIKTVTGTTYAVKNLSAGKATKYKIRAIGKNSSVGAFSEVLTAVTVSKAPKKLSAVTDNKTITLSWKANGKASGYEVERYNAAKGKWTSIGSTAKTTYTDSTITQSSTYVYRIRSYSQGVNKRYYSEYTPSVSVLFESDIEPESIYSQTMAENGILGYLYDPDENCFYTASDPLHRNFGYNAIYDALAPTVMIAFDTVRLKFDYDEKNWMIQIWKGQYGAVFYGAEIGVYNKPMDRSLEHYDCATDDELLKMSFEFYEYENNIFLADGWKLKFSRPYGSYWWCTGFIPGNKLGRFSSLRVDARITAKDYAMLSGITSALAEEGIAYTTSGLNIYFSYN